MSTPGVTEGMVQAEASFQEFADKSTAQKAEADEASDTAPGSQEHPQDRQERLGEAARQKALDRRAEDAASCAACLPSAGWASVTAPSSASWYATT